MILITKFGTKKICREHRIGFAGRKCPKCAREADVRSSQRRRVKRMLESMSDYRESRCL